MTKIEEIYIKHQKKKRTFQIMKAVESMTKKMKEIAESDEHPLAKAFQGCVLLASLQTACFHPIMLPKQKAKSFTVKPNDNKCEILPVNDIKLEKEFKKGEKGNITIEIDGNELNDVLKKKVSY
jgi:hypothetical protein